MAVNHFSGTGTPNGVVFGDLGDIYQDETGAFWFKLTGVNTNTGWVNVASGNQTNPMSPPEQWAVQNVAANVVALTPMSTQVSPNFPADIQMMRPGSVVGIIARLTQALTAGTIELEIVIDGTSVGQPGRLTLEAPTNGDILLIPVGTVPYNQSSLIGISYTSTADLAPAFPTGSNLEAWLEVVETAF